MRIKNSIKNISVAMGGQLIGILLNFINRTIFIKVLGAEYLGVNGLFSNIVSMLCLAELGIGSAIIYNMYKPLSNKDEDKISALMNFYAGAYKIIGCIVAVMGLALVPFLDTIIKDTPSIPKLSLIYIIFVINSVSTYFCAYKRTLLIADQKGYKDTINRYKFLVIQYLIQIAILLMTKNYILYLLIQVVCNIISNIVISRQVDLMYPFLINKKDSRLNNQEKKNIYKHVYAMMSHKVGGVVVSGTDNLLISSFLGVFYVGIYSNYVLVTSVINSILGQIFSSITASVGNLNAVEGQNKQKEVFNIMFFINAWLYGFAAITLMVLLNSFIPLWIGEEYLLELGIVAVIILNFYIMGMRQSTITFNTTLGLFWNDRYKPWVEAAINLTVSIILLDKIGFVGVLLGTFISTATTSLWVEPYILYKYGFNQKLRDYFKRYTLYTIVIGGAGVITYYLCASFPQVTWINLIIKLLICLIVPNIIIGVCLCKTKEIKYIWKLLKKLLHLHCTNSLKVDR